MLGIKGDAWKAARVAYAEVSERICGDWHRTDRNDRAACEFGFQHYLKHRAELEAAGELDKQARDEWRESGEPYPFPQFFSKITRWVVAPSD